MPLTVEQALSEIAAAAVPVAAAERPFQELVGAGATLAQDVVSGLDLPPFANSAMDGYALNALDSREATAARPRRLSLAGEARAGAPLGRPLARGSACRISTGAAMPEGADAVLRVEDAQVEGDELVVGELLASGHDVRPAGDDIAAGTTVVTAGTVLDAGELAMLAACGQATVPVRREVRVALVATGDELAPPGAELKPGMIYDSNAPMLEAQIGRHGARLVSEHRRVGDSLEATIDALRDAIAVADLVIVSGGVSMGEHDHVKPALAATGIDEIFWQLALRPGHPTWFGKGAARDDDGAPVLVLGLPGNPVSSFVTFELMAGGAIAALNGRDPSGRALVDAVYDGPPQKKPAPFMHVLRCTMVREQGRLVARATGLNQRSHAISSLVGANGLVFFGPGRERLESGDPVLVRPL